MKLASATHPGTARKRPRPTPLLVIGATLLSLGTGCLESPGGCEELAEAPSSLRGLRAELVGSVELPFAPALPALGDFDDDGNVEIAVADASGGGLIVFRGTPEDGYQAWQQEDGPHENRRVTAADLDRDGTDDLVAARVGFQGASSVVSSLNVVWGGPDFDLETGAQPDTEEVPGIPRSAAVAVVAGDFDNDGVRDVVYVGPSGTGYVFLGAGQRSFELGRRAGATGGREMAQATVAPGGQNAGDSLVTFGDNWGTTACNPDPATSTFGGVFLKRAKFDGETLSGDGGQSPWLNSNSLESRGQTGVALFDVLDGPELEAIGAFDTGLHVFRADSGGFVQELSSQACLGSEDSPKYVSGLTLADLDGDGTPEFVTLEASTKRLAVFGVGGTLLTRPVLVDAALPGGDELVSRDLDGDGIDELVVSDLDNRQVHVVRVLAAGA